MKIKERSCVNFIRVIYFHTEIYVIRIKRASKKYKRVFGKRN